MDFSGQYQCVDCAEVYPFRVSVCPGCGGKCSQISKAKSGGSEVGDVDICNYTDKDGFVRNVVSALKRFDLNIKYLDDGANYGIDLLCETSSFRIGIKIHNDFNSDFVGTDDVKDALAGKAILDCMSVIIVSTSAFTKAAFDWSNRTGVILRHPNDLGNYLRDSLGVPTDESLPDGVQSDQCIVSHSESSKANDSRYALIRGKLCVRCGSCVETCQNNAIEKNGVHYRIIKVKCTGCGVCVKACLSGAISIKSSADLDWCQEPTSRVLKAPFEGYVEMRGNGQVARVETGEPLFDIAWAGVAKTICAPCNGVVIPKVKTRRKYDKDTVICLLVDESEVSEYRNDDIFRRDQRIVRAGCSGWIKDIKAFDGMYVHSGRVIVDIDFYGLMTVSVTAQQKGHVALKCSKGQFVKFGQEIAEVKN